MSISAILWWVPSAGVNILSFCNWPMWFMCQGEIKFSLSTHLNKFASKDIWVETSKIKFQLREWDGNVSLSTPWLQCKYGVLASKDSKCKKDRHHHMDWVLSVCIRESFIKWIKSGSKFWNRICCRPPPTLPIRRLDGDKVFPPSKI